MTFLTSKTIRSKKEVHRLHELSKPQRELPVRDSLPPVDSHSEDEDGWNSDLDSEDSGNLMSDLGESTNDTLDSDQEMSYEAVPREQQPADRNTEPKGILRLPIKLADGRIQNAGQAHLHALIDSEESSSEEEEQEPIPTAPLKTEDVATGARFGRAAVIDIITIKSRKSRIQAAKTQIAGICQDILAEPEDSVRGHI
jgi:nucleolar complex protein 3